ncbi:hypothetical protein ABOZ73_16550 [Caulobacter sp. 73W]|uniref:Uncharacterized protein n=1 Tax=Caulobacter sp. 73W TaxID=3161137 RepID=A0AB39KSV6_9CAUL
MITFDSSLLLGYYQARSNVAGAAAAASSGGASNTNRVVAPWASSNKDLKADALMKKVLGGRKFIDEGGEPRIRRRGGRSSQAFRPAPGTCRPFGPDGSCWRERGHGKRDGASSDGLRQGA